MKLKASIASYNSNGLKARGKLNENYIDTIYNIAASKNFEHDSDNLTIRDLVSMNILKVENESIKLNTTVFLEDDIREISELANEIGLELAKLLIHEKTTLDNEIPEIKTFLAAVIAVTQGLSQYVFQNNLGSEWKDYKGEYAKTKIDFDEICEIGNSIGEHLLQKSIVVGNEFTAVFIGPRSTDINSIMRETFEGNANFDYTNHKEIIDNFGLLFEGKFCDSSYEIASKYIGILNDKYIITEEYYLKHVEAINNITKLSSKYYSEKMSLILSVLSKTTSGKQGVKPDSMLMHFWRYFSRVLAKKLYDSKYLIDDIQSKGWITVLFKNNVKELSKSFN